MPRFSIVVPAHNVQAFVGACLDSILRQSLRDLEVIVVDDASTDDTGAIVDSYVVADERVQAVHLPRNVGAGLARNVGLDRATGDYVLFADGDDWLADDALEAIDARLWETGADVLIFDHADVSRSGTVRRSNRARLYRSPLPPVFRAAEHPDVLRMFWTPWNKVFRREFLIEQGIRFTPGYYEDVPVSYPALLAAERIAVLNQVCYYYRRRPSAATASSGRAHFVVFEQYDRVFDFIAAHDLQAFQPLMFELMMLHVVYVFKLRRIPPELRKEFFAAMSEAYRKHAPPGFTPSRRLDKVRYRAIRRNDYRAYTAATALALRRARLRDRTRARVRGAAALARKAGSRGLLGYYAVQRRRPLDETLAVYTAYWSQDYACNPRAVYEKARELAPHVRGVWVVDRQGVDRIPADVDRVILGSPEYYRVLATAKYLVNNVNFPNSYVKRAGSVYLQTHHGTPLKTMGVDLARYPVSAKGMDFPALLRRCDAWDLSLVSNRHSALVWERTYPCRYETVRYGYPRNDRYYTATAADVARLRAQLGIAPGRLAVLYAPTLRDHTEGFEPPLDLARFCRALGPDVLVLARAHYSYSHRPLLGALEQAGVLRDVSAVSAVEDVALAADVLVTDYSSIMFDYANLDRPIVLHVPDYEVYRAVRGMYFDVQASPPGMVTRSDDELIGLFQSGRWRSEEAAKLRAEFRRRFCEYDDGHAAERCVRRLFLGELDLPAPVPLEERTPAPPPEAVHEYAPSLDR